MTKEKYGPAGADATQLEPISQKGAIPPCHVTYRAHAWQDRRSLSCKSRPNGRGNQLDSSSSGRAFVKGPKMPMSTATPTNAPAVSTKAAG